MKKLSNKEAEEKIREFFLNIKNKSPREIKKIKKLAMRHSMKLGKLRKRFCKKCFMPLKGKTRTKNKIKTVICNNCGYESRWKIKS